MHVFIAEEVHLYRCGFEELVLVGLELVTDSGILGHVSSEELQVVADGLDELVLDCSCLFEVGERLGVEGDFGLEILVGCGESGDLLVELRGDFFCIGHFGRVLSCDLLQLFFCLLQLRTKLGVGCGQFLYFSLELLLLLVGSILKQSNGFVEALLLLGQIMQVIFHFDLSILLKFESCLSDIKIMLQFRPNQL